MADPLSLTASIIAVIGAVEVVAKTLKKISSIRNAPNELLALVNEISDFRIILSDVENHNVKNTESVPQQQLQHMSILLNRAKDQLLQLDELVQNRLIKPNSTLANVKVSRLNWSKASGTIEEFRKRLKDVRMNLIALLAVENS